MFVSDEVVPTAFVCHRQVLSRNSNFFNAILSENWQEETDDKTLQRVVLHGVDPVVFYNIIQ